MLVNFCSFHLEVVFSKALPHLAILIFEKFIAAKIVAQQLFFPGKTLKTNLMVLLQLIGLFRTPQIQTATDSESGHWHSCQLAVNEHIASPLGPREARVARMLWTYAMKGLYNSIPGRKSQSS